MYSNFKAQAIEYVKQAIEEDNASNYAKAFPLYMNALEYFKTHLKYEPNPKMREEITKKFGEYLRRAEEIRAVLDENCGPWPSSNDGTNPYLKAQATEYVKQAIEEDNAGNYTKAIPLYMNALENFNDHLKYEQNPKTKEAITQIFMEYLRRASEEIRAVLDENCGPGPASTSNEP